MELGEDWAKGPAKYLLTSAERQDFERLSDSLARSEYIAVFWKAHDPKPETPENEFRDEFERRVAFADLRFDQDETRGSLTDRGMVFILLGPPTYNGQKPLAAGDEAGAADTSGQSRYGRAEQSMAEHGRAGNAKTAQINEVGGASSTVGRSAANWIETWHYLRARAAEERPLPGARPAVRDQGGLRQERPPARAERAHGARAREEARDSAATCSAREAGPTSRGRRNSVSPSAC